MLTRAGWLCQNVPMQAHPPEISSKLPDVGTTIFTIMSQLAEDCKAINLSQGFPSFEPPAELIDRIDHYRALGVDGIITDWPDRLLMVDQAD